MSRQNRPGRRRTIALTLVALLALLGAFVSTVLVHHHRDINYSSPLVKAVCGAGEGSGCDVVNRSASARLFGLPLAQWGFYFYGAAFLLAAMGWMERGRRPSLALFYLVGLGCVVDVALLLYSLLGLGAVCNLCVLTYLITFGMLLFAWMALRASERPAEGAWIPRLRSLDARASIALLFGFLALFSTAGYLNATIRPVEEQYRDLLGDPEEALYVAWTSFYKSYLKTEPVKIETGNSPKKGARNPVLFLTLFADFQCPHCKRTARALGELVDRHRDAVELTYKHYPLDQSCNCESESVHVGACKLAYASYAAERQGKFWYFHDLLYANQHLWKAGVSETQILNLAGRAGFDTERFEVDMNSQEARDRIAADVEEANRLELVTGTPTLFINGRVMESIPLGDFLEELVRQETERLQPFGKPRGPRGSFPPMAGGVAAAR